MKMLTNMWLIDIDRKSIFQVLFKTQIVVKNLWVNIGEKKANEANSYAYNII